MPRLSKTATPVEFGSAHGAAVLMNETNDCAVKAVVIATGEPYEKVHAIMKRLGREDRKGTAMTITEATIKELGWRWRRWGYLKMQEQMRSYPGIHGSDRGVKNMTTHHPRRFREQWRKHDGKIMLLRTPHHILCYRDGEVKDWSINRSLKIIDIYELEKA